MPMNMTEWKLVQGARSLLCFDRFIMAKSSVVVFDIMAAARLLIPDPGPEATGPLPGRISWEVALVVGCALKYEYGTYIH